jgi:hypothetical protein
MMKTARQTKLDISAGRGREHIQRLIDLLAAKTDALARRTTCLQREHRETPSRFQAVYDEMDASDRRHIQWLKEQIVRMVVGE